MTINYLNGFVFSENEKNKRDVVVEDAFVDMDFCNNYDFKTLFYDAFYIRREKKICLICPKLINFEEIIRRARFAVGATTLRICSIRKFKRYAEIRLRYPDVPAILKIEIDGNWTEVKITCDDIETFSGLNCAVIMSKNNDLRWIRDWADYHVKMHGLQGLVFFDNASEKYSVDDITTTLSHVKGLSKLRVIPTPYTYGVYSHVPTWFLQVSLLNIARLRFLSSAAAVLSTDIDELVEPTPEGGVFNSTKRSLLGYLLFRGRWRHAQPTAADATLRHADHIYKTENDFYKATKFCICPKRICGFSHWDIHGSVRGFMKKCLVTDRFAYWHCRQLSTNWLYARDGAVSETLLPAQDSIDTFNAVFGELNLEVHH